MIVISGIDDEEHARVLVRLGAFACLAKPFRLEEVEGAVERALESQSPAS